MSLKAQKRDYRFTPGAPYYIEAKRIYLEFMSLKSLTINLLLLFVGASLALVVTEVLLRVFYPETTKYYVLRPGTKQIFKANPKTMPGVSGEALYEVNKDGIRGRVFGSDNKEYRVLAIGGSTTECLYLSEEETWTKIVETRIKNSTDGRSLWIGNVGRSGMTARDHVLHVKHLLEQYPRIDALFVMVGVNDLTGALKHADKYKLPTPITDPQAQAEQVKKAFLVAPGKIHKPSTEFWLSEDAPWFKKTAIWQILKRLKMQVVLKVKGKNLAQDDSGEIYNTWRNNRKNASRIIESLPDLTKPLQEYELNLKVIADLAKEKKVRLIFITQPYLWRFDLTQAEKNMLWLGGVGEFQSEAGHEYYSVGSLAAGMFQFNDVLLSVCKDKKVECIDLAPYITKTTKVFYDDVHFTEYGSVEVATLISDHLTRNPL